MVGGKIVQQSIGVSETQTTPVQSPQQVVIRSVPKTIISNVVKSEPTASTSGVPMQKIITTTTASGQVQGNIISSTNLQQLLQRGNVQQGQKIVLQSGPGGVQKVLVASSPHQQQPQQGEKRIIVQNASGQQQQYILQQNQNTASPQQQQFVTIGGQKLILQTSGGSQQVQQMKTAIPQQQIQLQIQEPQQQQQQGQQIIIQQQNSNNNIAQQISQGKVQVMNLNGQQVLVKSVGNNQSVIVGQVKTSQVSPIKPSMATIISSPQTHQVIKTVQATSTTTSDITDQALLAKHPPGTVLKCVTAQVMQTPSGPRIVLQGLQGTDISPQQSQVLQQQVKQQLMKGRSRTTFRRSVSKKFYLFSSRSEWEGRRRHRSNQDLPSNHAAVAATTVDPSSESKSLIIFTRNANTKSSVHPRSFRMKTNLKISKLTEIEY